MTVLRIVMLCCLITSAPLLAAAAPPVPAIAGERNPAIIDAQVMCDYRGCFGFGPQQWHRPAYIQPNFRPPGNTPPTYIQPRAAGKPRLYYNVQPPAATTYRPPAPTLDTRHVHWCQSKYRSYEPSRDRYMTYRGTYARCMSPYR